MSSKRDLGITRRGFVRSAGAAALGASAVVPATAPAAPAGGEIPRCVLGRTGLEVTRVILGTAPCGIAKTISSDEVAKIVRGAIDLGINFVDTSPQYGNGEEGVGKALGGNRGDVLLATKVLADDVEIAEKKLAATLKTLKTDSVDLLYFHSVGNSKVDKAMKPDGVFTWLLKQKKAGKCRFLGISGHNRPRWFVGFLESGEVDVLLANVSFVDRYTYNFEEIVLPVARKHNAGIFAMKVFGGPNPKTGGWGNPNAKANVGEENVELAIRYALGLPGVTAVNLGVHNLDQVRQNIEFVKRFKPLEPKEETKLAVLGKKLAADWGEHFGPVV